MKYFNDTFRNSIAEELDAEVDKYLENLEEDFPNAFELHDFDYVHEEADSEACRLADQFDEDMERYVHMEDTSMSGNFCNIRRDYKSEFGKDFDATIKKFDDEISDEDTEEFKNWVEGWFFEAFGTFGIRYNFSNTLDTIMESDIEEMRNEEGMGFHVIFDITDKNENDPLESYEDAKEELEGYLRDSKQCANPAYIPQWKIIYRDRECHETVIIDDMGDGVKGNFEPDNGSNFIFEEPVA